MKKVLALVLAVALSLSMASVAFAAMTPTEYAAATAVNPGEKLEIPVVGNFNPTGDGDAITADYVSADYFSIKVDYGRGKDLVKEVKFDSGKLVIEFVGGTAEVPSVANFQIEKITLTGKKNGITETYRNKKYELDAAVTVFSAKKVGYEVSNIAINDDFNVPYTDSAIVKFTTNDYGLATFDFDDRATAEVRVYKNEKFFIGVEGKADLDIVKANPDADLEFLSFKGKPSFSANAKVEIFADEDTFLYEIKDGKLVKSSLKYDDDAGAFTGKARTLGAYVISDIELVNASTTEETKNPDTGANDVVGVAVALAVVSLVAAGAVSLKK